MCSDICLPFFSKNHVTLSLDHPSFEIFKYSCWNNSVVGVFVAFTPQEFVGQYFLVLCTALTKFKTFSLVPMKRETPAFVKECFHYGVNWCEFAALNSYNLSQYLKKQKWQFSYMVCGCSILKGRNPLYTWGQRSSEMKTLLRTDLKKLNMKESYPWHVIDVIAFGGDQRSFEVRGSFTFKSL